MKRTLAAALAATTLICTTPTVASAATWSPKDVQKAVYVAGGLAVVGLITLNNARNHARADNARHLEIEAALAERNARLKGELDGRRQRARSDDDDYAAPPTPGYAPRYRCAMVNVSGVCIELVPTGEVYQR